MDKKGKDNILIGIMVIFTYFIIYTFMADLEILKSIGGLPMINCITDFIQKGFSFKTLFTLTKDFGQTIIIIFMVIFVENLIPEKKDKKFSDIIASMIGYVLLYLAAMWIVRYIVFSDKMSEIIKMFLAIFSVVMGCIGVIVISPLLGIIVSRKKLNEGLISYLSKSRIMQWLANAFFVSSVIMFIAVAIEMTIGLPYFFKVVLSGTPSFIMGIVILVAVYNLIRWEW